MAALDAVICPHEKKMAVSSTAMMKSEMGLVSFNAN
jgi:hypothetical protein